MSINPVEPAERLNQDPETKGEDLGLRIRELNLKLKTPYRPSHTPVCLSVGDTRLIEVLCFLVVSRSENSGENISQDKSSPPFCNYLEELNVVVIETDSPLHVKPFGSCPSLPSLYYERVNTWLKG